MTEISTKRSSFIEAMVYDPENKTLTIVFLSSERRYRYYGISPQKVARLQKSQSKGSYYASKIKGQYKMRRLPMAS